MGRRRQHTLTEGRYNGPPGRVPRSPVPHTTRHTLDTCSAHGSNTATAKVTGGACCAGPWTNRTSCHSRLPGVPRCPPRGDLLARPQLRVHGVARTTVVFGAAFMLAMRRKAWSATYRPLLGRTRTAVLVFSGFAFAFLMIACLYIACRQATGTPKERGGERGGGSSALPCRA